MADDKIEIVATCQCLRNRFTTTALASELPISTPICQCYQCRHGTGNICVQDFEWPGFPEKTPDLSALSSYDFSPKVRILFCPACGTQIFFHTPKDKKQLCALVGTVDNVDRLVKFDRFLWLSDAKDGGVADWLSIIDSHDLTRFAGNAYDTEREVAAPTLVEETPAADTSKTDTLDIKCLCSGVHFHVSRPSAVFTDSTDANPPFWRDTKDRFLAMLCMCADCRLSAGSAFLSLAYMPTSCMKQADGSAFSLKSGTLTAYRSSDIATRYFCKVCGAFVFYVSNEKADEETGLVGAGAGLLCASSGAKASEWLVWRTHKVSFQTSANHTGLGDALQNGLKGWGAKKYGKESDYLDPSRFLTLFKAMN